MTQYWEQKQTVMNQMLIFASEEQSVEAQKCMVPIYVLENIYYVKKKHVASTFSTRHAVQAVI